MISSKPDTLKLDITDTEHILFLASDGVWDVLEEEEIFEFCREFIANNSPKG